MSTVPVFVGLDYHSNAIQVCILAADGHLLANRSLRNDAIEVDQFVRRQGPVCGAAIEACPGAAHLADELATQKGWDIRQAHPGFVSRMRQTPDKTDWADARVLADLVRVGYLPTVWLAPEEVRELRRVTRLRQQLVDTRRSIKLRVRAVLRECRVKLPARGWTKAWRAELAAASLPDQARWVIDRHLRHVTFYDGEIAAVEKRIAKLVAQDAVVAKLTRQVGVGLVTAAVMRAEIGRFDRFRNGKQLARYCGLTPHNASSGQRQADAGLVKAGNPYLRTVLIEAAHRLGRLDPRWKQLRDAMRSRGKSGSVVAAAVANRWVRGLVHAMTLAA
ncbi:MAG TPA: IS110 family transposase [Fimbriiglobus sp.]|nr:IS110 family transposase [Fimbriiglobus sp.]